MLTKLAPRSLLFLCWLHWRCLWFPQMFCNFYLSHLCHTLPVFSILSLVHRNCIRQIICHLYWHFCAFCSNTSIPKRRKAHRVWRTHRWTNRNSIRCDVSMCVLDIIRRYLSWQLAALARPRTESSILVHLPLVL